MDEEATSPPPLSSSWILNRHSSIRENSRVTPFRKYGKLNTTRRSIYSTTRHVVEHFGPQMPRSVIESLIYSSDAKVNSSVNINPECGWGWYVCGRKLLVWPVVPSSEKIPPTVIARELQLPSSDLAHSANLVAVYVEPGNKAASCIAVTPEGLVRCWPTIGQYCNSFDVNTHLGGEEVCAVRYIPPLGCLAVTTTASMILLTPTIIKGMPTVTVHQVSVPQGWISGLSRRVSSIIFGVPPAQGLESRIVKVLTKQKSDSSWHVFLLSGLTLQSWNINKHKPHEMFFECDLTRMINAAFQDTPNEESEIIIQDMKYSEMGLLFLAVSSRPRNYIIVEVTLLQEHIQPSDCTRLCSLTQQDISTVEGISGKIATLQFLSFTDSALVFNDKVILGVQMTAGKQIDADKLDIPGGLVMGGHMYDKVPLFFSATYGFVSVSPIDTSCMDVINSSLTKGPSLMVKFFETEKTSVCKVDCVASVKTAFIYYVRKNLNQSKAVISRDFPSPGDSPVDSPLATTLVKVSLDIINDTSSKDPRWGDKNKSSTSLPGVTSLQLETQLIEKQQAHDLFLQFVKDLSLTEDIGRVKHRNYSSLVSTMSVLYEHNEKITVAITLRKLQKEYSSTVNALIELTCEEHDFMSTTEITNQDFFYRNVCFVDDGLRALCKHCENLSKMQLHLMKSFDKIIDANNILIEVFRAVINRREEMQQKIVHSTCIPWLSAVGPSGLFDYIMKMNEITFSIITTYKSHVDAETLRNQLLYISDVILYSQKDYSSGQTFYQLRSYLIRQFIRIHEMEKAIMLAEKFKDFAILTEICFELKTESRLIRYFEQYGQEGFCEAVFEWYLLEKKIPQLLDLPLPVEHYSKLTKFLERYPNIAWLHTIRSGDFQKTCNLLLRAAMKTSKPAIKKERMLALCKLAACASHDNLELDPEVSKQLQILRIQRKLPAEALEKSCCERNSVKAFSIKELILLFTSEDNNEKIENFCYALKLLKFLDGAEAVELKNIIWVRAIKRNAWNYMDLTSPLDELNRIFFFQLLQVVASPNFESVIPAIEDIFAHEELQYLKKNGLFRYLFSYAYENLGISSSEIHEKQT